MEIRKISAEEAKSMHGILANHSEMTNGELRFRLKNQSDDTGYILTRMSADAGWQEAHYHENIVETYIVQQGWVGYAECTGSEEDITIKDNVTVFGAEQMFTTQPGVIHNLYIPADTVVHTVKHGVSERVDRTVDAVTHRFTELTSKMAEGSILEKAARVPNFLISVEHSENNLRPKGQNDRDFSHRCGIAHTSVLLVPIRRREGKIEILLHKRPVNKLVSPSCWDIFGGHVETTGNHPLFTTYGRMNDQSFFHRIIDATAVREANEEIIIPNFQFGPEHLHLFENYGDYEYISGTPGSGNVEYSSLYLTVFPGDFQEVTAHDTVENDTVEITNLPSRFIELDTLLAEFQADNTLFADGVSRLLQRLLEPERKARFESTIMDLPLNEILS